MRSTIIISKRGAGYIATASIVRDGKVIGGTTVCAKCGRAALDEAAWL